jgi:hypothetical protein
MGWLKDFGKNLWNWWQNQKWVVEKWLFPLLDSFLVPKIEEFINTKKQEIIDALNSYSGKHNAIKAVEWIKDRLRELLKLKNV